MKNKWICAAILAAVAGASLASEADVQRVRDRMRNLYPATRVDAVNPTPIAGLYEVVMGANVAYVEPSGRFFLFGRLYDMQARKDITSVSQAAAERADVSRLPLADAIKTVHGTGRRTLYVFADPNCPHCRHLDQSLSSVGDVTVYTFLYPVLGEDSMLKARVLWCASDRAAAWSDWAARGAAPSDGAECSGPIDRNLAAGRALNVQGTPTMFSADGRRLSGALPAGEIAAWLDQTASKSTSLNTAKD